MENSNSLEPIFIKDFLGREIHEGDVIITTSLVDLYQLYIAIVKKIKISSSGKTDLILKYYSPARKCLIETALPAERHLINDDISLFQENLLFCIESEAVQLIVDFKKMETKK